uniref:Uncharacterized protein n=1 Tax=viral metagenome TaxID=1070528 RepID=A0A6M3JFM5_9ZZZZ
MNKRDYREYEKNVKDALAGLAYVSSGPCPDCNECLECDTPDDPSMEWYDLASEPSFSWSSCNVCGSGLGGDRYPAHGADKNGNIIHFDVCTDCYYYMEYGQLDNTTMMEIEEGCSDD